MKRDDTPPYEIMRRPASEGSAPAPAVSRKRGPGLGSPWWVGSSAPLVVRVPRGMAVVIVAGVIGLIVLAYWVGYSRGYGAALARENPEEIEHIPRQPPARFGSQDPSGTNTTVDSDKTSGGAATDSSRDPRRSGLNYVVMATRKPEDARPLIAFLNQWGVETVAVSVNNGRFVQIVAVNKGFEGGQRLEEDGRAYLSWLREAGQAWKKHNSNRGDDLSSMYWDLYEAPKKGSE